MIYNSHIHTFKDTDIPRAFLPLGLVRILSTKRGARIISKILNNINPFSDNDAFDRYVKFVEIGRLGSQEAIFKECKRFYPRDSRFGVLAMDMAYMGAGKVPRSYKDQLQELGELKQKCPEVIPFVHIDPRREGYLELLKLCVEEWGYRGVKVYPPLGYFPYDERMYPVYEYCQKHSLPVITHCSPFNPVHFKGKKKELRALLQKSKDQIDTKGMSRKVMCSQFTNPLNWEYVMADFPDLKLCLGHFGSSHYWKQFLDNPGKSDNWFLVIKEMLEKYPNLYSDISFTLNEQEFFPLLKVLLQDKVIRPKVLFGSDYYMVETEATERRFSIDLRAFLGEKDFMTIAKDNPERFFKTKLKE
ncbi:amidohydrolase family protein [Carboxylicivirga sp. M1479]|uniref:amidohydrolase family protein n=1 Tax=Carboxylicivirga sp. M1479 TaxID=2594476 RepID=UPI001178010F|nr:amidohydrolase family protein [Carboxylicivirga sp. M1479]TRX72487.1 amidohydrolase family protein [Carboxylicivirga sp. M1479]